LTVFSSTQKAAADLFILVLDVQHEVDKKQDDNSELTMALMAISVTHEHNQHDYQRQDVMTGRNDVIHN
jgi:hypothetical protein